MWVAGDFKTNKMRGYLRVLIHTITLEAPRSEKNTSQWAGEHYL